MSVQTPDSHNEFLPLNSSSPFNNLVGPYSVKLHDGVLVIGLKLEDKHCNNSGKLHGAMIAAIFDTVLGHNVGLMLARGSGKDLKQYATGAPGAPVVTVSLNTDYLGTATSGDWVEATAQTQRTGKSLVFANAELFCNAERIAKASGIFRIFA